MEGESAVGPVTDSIMGESSDPIQEHLTDRDRLVIRETLEDIAERPLPPDLGPLGCVAGLAGAVVLVSWPWILKAIPAASFFTPFALTGGVLALVGGPVASFFRGGAGRAAAGAAVESALRHLEDPESDRETCVRATTLLLSHAFHSQGPTTVQIVSVEDAAPRIGKRMELVRAVERLLVDENVTYPVFSHAEGRQDSV